MSQRTCSTPDCPKPVRRRGWCSHHNSRYELYGDPLALSPQEQKRAWLAEVAAETDRTGCRDWPWGVSSRGYAQVWEPLLGRVLRVSHVVLTMDGRTRAASGPRHALHSCDRPVCAAPWHLRWGTDADNLQDSIQRGRRDHLSNGPRATRV